MKVLKIGILLLFAFVGCKNSDKEFDYDKGRVCYQYESELSECVTGRMHIVLNDEFIIIDNIDEIGNITSTKTIPINRLIFMKGYFEE